MSHSTHDFSAGVDQHRYISQEVLLREKALQFISDFPDVHAMAWASARSLIHELSGKKLNPDKVWWHRFDGAASSSRSYTGWEHAGAPVESMTLVELVMHRFNAHDQSASDELDLYSGFYTDGPQHGRYDERNEVPMLARQVLQKFWALDFAGLFQQRVNQFWRVHGATFTELAKARLLAAAGLAASKSGLPVADLQRLVLLLGHGDNTVAASQPVARQGLSIRSFDIGGHESSLIIRMVDAGGRQILYTPGLKRVFHVFETERQLHEWVRDQLHDEHRRQRFEALFVFAPQATRELQASLSSVLDQLRDRPFMADLNLIDPVVAGLFNRNDRPLTGDVFAHLRARAEEEMQEVARALTSNADLRKQIWIGYLSAFTRIIGPLAIAGWPLALVMVGAGVANVGLNIDQALHGKNARQRQAGLVGAVLNSIFVLFNLPLLADAAAGVRVSVAEVPAAEGAVVVEQDPQWIAMQPLSHERLLSGEIPLQGIERDAAGETWIMLDDTPQRVRFSARLNAWIVIDPENPFAFFDITPVRLNEQGQWQRLPGLRLSGGMEPINPGAPSTSQASALELSTVQSQFWDLYMQFNLDEEETLSMLALDRQKAAIDIREQQPGDEIERDSEGDQVLVDAWNNEYRVFRNAAGRYVGGRVTRYTENEHAINDYLRTGVAGITNQVEMIEELLEDLNLIGLDNRVNLYRGGSGVRGTSGMTFRNGHIKAGDVLVNTDFTSFSENPYVTRSFASSQAGAPSYGFSGQITFDDTSIVFELPAGQHLGATPIAPFSIEDEEAESLFTPGHYFQVQGIHEVVGSQYRFVRVQLKEVPAPAAGRALYEMRTGLPFTREQYASRLGVDGQRLVERFFPLPLDLSQPAASAPAAEAPGV
ncbi:ADP-ribosylating toxin [Pseudomonas sp. 21LCFQ010]|uniref:dermonecrotic toxin domain-containing protein n=1 Tax=Pseudomonas sp. 21LCFQ010 TaxID=2957506 RepID=UPI0020983254|nr:DUF6543 domain-containing protein [Pseudomonas sp. 21LCFQ010]MCO8162632.1 ADP-ribosylating toxin [Pseudomonas sp. 21LCFQ010]